MLNAFIARLDEILLRHAVKFDEYVDACLTESSR